MLGTTTTRRLATVMNYRYKIGQYEVSNTEYAAFLNDVASTDQYGLYNSNMAINRAGSDGSYSYSVQSGMDNKAVTYVSVYDSALRELVDRWRYRNRCL